jgi:hypothetical protein
VRVDIFCELEAGDPQLELPWASPRAPLLCYIDLERFPEKIDELPECRRYPALAFLLRQVNRKACALRTAKCDVWLTTKLAEDERLDFPVPFKVGSYVDMVFASSRLNARLNAHLRLGKEFERSLRSCRVQAQVELAVRRCLFHPRERWGFYVTLFVHAYGSTRVEAKQEWIRAIECIRNALSKIGPDFAARNHP